MGEPVSWFVIEQGWQVVGRDGSELGTVEETLGDSSLDIFDGLTVASGVLSKRYVPSELVAEILEGSVKLSVDKDGFERLDRPPA